jgi:hypothetical protein
MPRDHRRWGGSRARRPDPDLCWHRPYLLSGLIRCGHCGKSFQAHKQVRGREPAYYVCGGYIASGLSVCDSRRILLSHLDEAVLDGVRKRREHILDRSALCERLSKLLQGLEHELAQITRKIGRSVEVLALGTEDLPTSPKCPGGPGA